MSESKLRTELPKYEKITVGRVINDYEGFSPEQDTNKSPIKGDHFKRSLFRDILSRYF